MDKLRRIGGEMESFRRPGGRRVLLPAEVELCKTIGITEDEYWYFIELTQAYNGKRPKEYDDIPYIINMPAVSAFFSAVAAGNAAAQIALGIILTVVSVVLAPKPRPPKTPPSLTTAGQTGPKRFAPQTGFNSVQELATLGEIVPLIFTKQEITKTSEYIEVSGGVRVNTRLLWSQMISLGSSQQLKALFMIGLGPLSSRPDFSGYAIGDLLLKNYINKKIALYMRKAGGRPKELNRYDEGTLPKQKDRNGSVMNDVMSVDWDAAADGSGAAADSIVSGTRAPNTQVQFGAYSPMPNSMRYRVPYELVLKQKNLESDNKKDINKKRKKITTNFPRYCSFYAMKTPTDTEYVKQDRTDAPLNVDDTIRYTIADYDTEEEFEGKFEPWGVEDVKSAVDATREEADDAIQIGESYLAGSALVVCIDRSNTMWNSKTYQNAYFRCDTPGVVDIRTGTADLKAAHKGYELLTLQKAAIGTISNTKVCDVTEIGLKSKVFKQVTSFPNVNSHPGAVEMDGVDQDSTKGVVKRYQDDDGNIALGPMSKYLMRYSFFRLQARIAGVGDIDWQYIDKGQPFAIKGNLPQPQYNFIRINHYNSADREFEFRFLPFPGNLIKRNFVDKNKAVRILNAAEDLESYEVSTVGQDYEIFYRGTDRKLRRGDVSNTEWYLGALPTADKEGKVKEFVKTKKGNIPIEKRWVAIEERTTTTNVAVAKGDARVFRSTIGGNKTFFTWDRGNQKGHWEKSVDYSKNTVQLVPKSKAGIKCIKRNGFKYCNGAFVGSLTHNVKNNRKGHYFGMTKYEYKKVNVIPQIYDDYQVNGGSGQDLTVTLKVYRDPDNNKFKAARWEVKNSGKNYKDSDQVTIPKTGNADSDFPGIQNVNIVTDFNDFVTEPWPKGKNLNPYDAINDYYQYDAERSSHLDGPEHEIVYVNEQTDLGEGSGPTYDFDTPKAGIANIALRLSSSKEWNSFSQFSVYIKNGLKIKRLINDNGETVTDGNTKNLKTGVDSDGFGPTNNFAEIVHALLTEEKFGLVDSIGAPSVDKERMIIAAKFCEANGFYWDGVITDKQNIREFIYQNAVFNLLDFTILGGKFSLFPSVPFNSDFKIDGTIKPKVCALFTDGNTKNLKVSFLSPEERQNFIGTVYFRKEVENGFPSTESLSLYVADEENPAKLPIEVFDMSDFCTNEDHAKDFLRHALKVREKVDHGITFETTPQAIAGLKPGDYIRFISEATHTDRFENGVISFDGVVQSVGNKPITNETIYYWKPGTDEVKELANFTVVNGKTTKSELHGAVFTVKQTTASNRLYKVESLAYSEEGLINVGASHAPLLDDGTLATINYISEDFGKL